MKLAGQKIPLTDMLLARIVDELSFISWSKTKDGQRGQNRPESVLKALIAEPKENETEAFDTPEDFEAEWKRITESANA